MNKLTVFDATGMKWFIEDCPCGCGNLWVHLYDDNNYHEHSGSNEPDLESAMRFLDGYMGCENDPSVNELVATMKLVGDAMSCELPDTARGCALKERWNDAKRGITTIER
jgi:hypothetical protein